jgi:hypothetical protein
LSSIQRATIVTLIIATLAVWGLGLRAALRAGARADQEPVVTSTEAHNPDRGCYAHRPTDSDDHLHSYVGSFAFSNAHQPALGFPFTKRNCHLAAHPYIAA